ncbi:Putative SH3 domain-containing protein [Septoria linicola]|uniref:SH3 domain-containing protein n=1 Tax=Septoria linicola TaxID=215465 RepID=A0A9Q9AR20_9PEZI|nr:Putative SH3 domain-containing protein [Septoria linicola]
MGAAEEMQTAMVNRSIRTIKAELEYLCDASVISPQTLNDLLQKIPSQTALHAPISVGALPSAVEAARAQQVPPTEPMAQLNVHGNGTHNEKSNDFYQPTAFPQPAPPAYNAAPPPAANWPPLAQATALYAYSSTDAGDLELQPGEVVLVSEYMNAEWWKGKSQKTGREGIFPRSYVKVDEKAAQPGGPPAPDYSNNYGNAPLETSQMGNGEGKVPGKGQEMGKKFGKKLGNAAIFGAGATIGGNIVNSIF